MAGDSVESQPRFITEETEFVGKGDHTQSRHRRSRSRSANRLTPSALSLSDEHFYQDLEDYVKEMTTTDNMEPDVWTQLQQKESDLLLAAELGKALLEKNEELKKEQDKITEEYSKKLEELEQEKHLLRRRLDTTQGEYESRILELQNDIRELTTKIGSRDTSVKQRDEEKASLIAELTAQNSRLTAQLKESSATEQQLMAQLEGLKDQCSMRKTSLQDHVHSLSSLKAELALVSDKKADLERRLTGSLQDKENLMQQLEEANDRIVALERQLKEQEHLYHNTLKELERLQRSHDTLAERIGTPDTTDVTESARSLHAEMETEPDDDDDDGWLRKEAVQVYKQLRALSLQLNTGHDDDSGLHSDLSISSLDGDESSTLRRGALLAACADAVAAYATLEGSRVRDSIAAHARRALERERQIDEKNEVIADLSSKLSVAEVEPRAAAEERDKLLNDANYSSLQNDEAVTQARRERDEAIERKKTAEVALAKTRVELMQANSQLYEAVRQKVDLGQQLEQWQMDMQELIDEQMKHKLTSEKRRKLPSTHQRRRALRASSDFFFSDDLLRARGLPPYTKLPYQSRLPLRPLHLISDGDESSTLRCGALLAACADAVAAYATLEGSRVRDSIAAHARRALERERQIDEKNEVIADLSSKLSVAEVELRAAAEERDKLLNDANYSSLQNDEAVTQARRERDEAIERKKTAEVALAKTRVELMQANSQLYEAVRQKVDLGQQLEQWQMDMQELIDEQMKHKLTSEKRRKLPDPPAPTRASRLLGFFQR
ncbi:bicaudal D-related protein homolog [Leguminivora glycinivorella]|uniref:bicaudal D-related protein homolog n=1 Tax=Leguminivora glycinivorella TaxID=1035111 RepID=UPI00200ECF92|nr:bicaudal D-related protein homolog [Leguminivora glycinivorella]